jgi:hypothetical protein
MPVTRPVRRPSRRAVLLGLLGTAGLAVAGCEGEPPNRVVRPTVDPDQEVTDAAIADIQGLLSAYDANLAAYPALTARLTPLREHHVAHLRALGASPASPSASPSTASTASPSIGTSSTTASPIPPTTAAASIAAVPGELATRERAASEQRLRQALLASPGLARLLAGIGASEASHATVLRAAA